MGIFPNPALVFVVSIWYNLLSMECGPCPGLSWKEVYVVYRKLTRLLAPHIGLYFCVMLAFVGVTALLEIGRAHV